MGVASPLEGFHLWTGIVLGQFKHRQVSKLLPPVGQMTLHDLSLQALMLPESKVCILNRQWGKWRGRVQISCKRVVELAQLREEHSDGPAIRADMVQSQQQNVLFSRMAEQSSTQRHIFRQIKGLPGFFNSQLLAHLDLLLQREGAQIDDRQEDGEQGFFREEHLRRFSMRCAHLEDCTQALMPMYDLAKAALQGRFFEITRKPKCHWDSIKRILRSELMQEPETLLRK